MESRRIAAKPIPNRVEMRTEVRKFMAKRGLFFEAESILYLIAVWKFIALITSENIMAMLAIFSRILGIS